MNQTFILQNVNIKALIFWNIFIFLLVLIITNIISLFVTNVSLPVIQTSFDYVFYITNILLIILNVKIEGIKQITKFDRLHLKYNYFLIGIIFVFFTYGIFIVEYNFLYYYSENFVINVLNEKIFYTKDESSFYVLLNIFNVIIGVVIAPIVEEFLFRGILLYKLSLKWGIKRGIIVSSIFFGVLHYEVIGGVILGVFFSLIFLKTKSLFIPMMLHMIINSVSYIISLLSFMLKGHEGLYTIDKLQSDALTGIILVILTFPLLIIFFHRNWPKQKNIF